MAPALLGFTMAVLASCSATAAAGTNATTVPIEVPADLGVQNTTSQHVGERAKGFLEKEAPENGKTGGPQDPVVHARDCPSVTLTCRISLSDASQMGSKFGCSGGATGNEQGISVNGQCQTETTTWRGTTWYDVGHVSTGQCFNLFNEGCYVENCPGGGVGPCMWAFDICRYGQASRCMFCQSDGWHIQC